MAKRIMKKLKELCTTKESIYFYKCKCTHEYEHRSTRKPGAKHIDVSLCKLDNRLKDSDLVRNVNTKFKSRKSRALTARLFTNHKCAAHTHKDGLSLASDEARRLKYLGEQFH